MNMFWICLEALIEIVIWQHEEDKMFEEHCKIYEKIEKIDAQIKKLNKLKEKLHERDIKILKTFPFSGKYR